MCSINQTEIQSMVLSSGRLESSGSDRPETDKTNPVQQGLWYRDTPGAMQAQKGVNQPRAGCWQECQGRLPGGGDVQAESWSPNESSSQPVVSNYFLSTSCVPGTVLDAEAVTLNVTMTVPNPRVHLVHYSHLLQCLFITFPPRWHDFPREAWPLW